MGEVEIGKSIMAIDSSIELNIKDKDGNETIEKWECHEDCPVKIMNEQSGILETHGTGKNPKMSNIGFGSNRRKVDFQEYKSDSGGAARFYYTAKASKSERNVGLEGMEKKILAKSRGAQQAIKDGKTEYLQDHIGFNRIQEMENVHPTVKPIDLMRYLVNMFSTPDGGVVYDPFAGSGSTLIACKILGREYIGSEMESEYYEIAKKRLQYDWVTWWATGKKDDFVKVKEEVKNKFF
jgi:tRNA G10  N-methylase Trm11